jgi:hypothetical protein
MGLFDHFQDEEHTIINGRGVLGGEGASEFETITSKPTPGQNGQHSPGYTFTLHCMNCSSQVGVSVGWVELVDLSAGEIPNDPDSGKPWLFSEGKATPPCWCPKCGKPLIVFLSPDEASKYVRTGVQMGAVNEQGVIARMHQIRSARQAYGQQRPQPR